MGADVGIGARVTTGVGAERGELTESESGAGTDFLITTAGGGLTGGNCGAETAFLIGSAATGEEALKGVTAFSSETALLIGSVATGEEALKGAIAFSSVLRTMENCQHDTIISFDHNGESL